MATMAEQYVRLRLAGAGSREAARLVGYSAGVPSPRARELYDAARRLSRAPAARHWIQEELAKVERRRRELKTLSSAAQLSLWA